MNFFKSVFSDPDPPSPPPDGEPDQAAEVEEGEDAPGNPNPNPNSWSFGGLIQTLAVKSESVIQTYRRDLEEFGTGLKKETAAIKDVAARAVRDLPVSLEAGASAAQESLETVGQAIDDFGGSVWRGTAEIISHGKDAFLAADPDSSPDPSSASSDPTSKRYYTRFEAQVLAAQSDPATFEEPEDAEEFQKWKVGFKMEDKAEEIENLLYDNGGLESLFEKLVPGVVDQETFWRRYYYRVYKLKQAEDARANLVKRVISREEEEDLSWEVDDDDDDDDEEGKEETVVEEVKEAVKEEEVKNEIVVEEKKPVEVKIEDLEASGAATDDDVQSTVVESVAEEVEKGEISGDGGSGSKTEDKVIQEVKSEPGESCKDSDVSVLSSRPSMQEEDDLGWDEIEDLGEHEDKKVGGSGGSPKRLDLRKRLSTAEDEEDLSWDIEDDDVPVKS